MSRILIVDDEQNVLNALRRELRDDYEIETFTSPLEALSGSNEAIFDMVISDYQMPGMNGVQFLKQFGRIQPDAARLILSGQADIDALVNAINETHIYRFVAKPWDKAELQSCIAQALDFRKLVLESRRQAHSYRMTHEPPAPPHETRKTWHIVLAGDDKVTLGIIRRGLTQDSDYAGVYGAMRREIAHHGSMEGNGAEFVVDAFTSGTAALNHVRHHDCELLITTQSLPDMEGMELLGNLHEVRPDAARILIGSKPDRKLLTQAINEARVHSFLYLYWDNAGHQSSLAHQKLNLHQIKTAVIQALASRDLLLEERRLAGLHRQG